MLKKNTRNEFRKRMNRKEKGNKINKEMEEEATELEKEHLQEKAKEKYYE